MSATWHSLFRRSREGVTARSSPARHRHRYVPFGRTAILIEAIAALAFLVYLLGHEAFQLPLLSSNYTIRAEFLDATGLKGSNHSPVLVAGVPEGRVQSVSYQHGLAVATLELPDSVRDAIHDDATVSVVPRSAIMDLMVDISPGSPAAPALRPGSLIPPSRTGSTVEWDRLIDVLDADTRAYTQVLLSELNIGLRGRTGQLRGALQELGNLVDGSTTVTQQLAERRVLLSRLVGSLDTMVTTLGQRQSDLAGAVDAGQRTLAVTAARSPQLSAMMQALPPAFAQLSGAMHALSALSGPLEPALVQLSPFARALPAALGSLRGFVPAGRTLIADLRALIHRGSTPVGDLQRALAALGPSSRGLNPTVKELEPILQAVNSDKQGIGQLGDNFSGIFSTNDANGVILRGLGFFEPFNPPDLGFPSSSSGSQLAREEAQTATALTRVCLHINPFACLVRYEVPGLPGAVAPLSKTPHMQQGRG